MFARIAVAAAVSCMTIGPVAAGNMNGEEARRFVAGKLFSFTCFEGTAGAGRIQADGSIAGIVRFQGKGPTRFLRMPPGTLHVKGGSVCTTLRGAFMQPCFDLTRTSEHSFRGAVSGFSFAYCDFVRRGARSELVRATSPARVVRAHPVQPVERAEIRSSIVP